MINYYLHQNKLGTAKEDSLFIARVKPNLHVNHDDMIGLMANKNTTVSRQDIVVVMDLLKEVLEEQLVLGNTVSTNIGRFYVSLGGGFASTSDEYDNTKHSLRIKAKPNTQLVSTVQGKSSVSRVRYNPVTPVIDTIYDMTSQSFSSDLVAGALIELRGNLFKGEDSDKAGVFFVNSDTDVVTKISSVYRTLPSSILLSIPEDLEAGNYTVEVRTMSGSVLRTGSYYDEVTVM
ncbi:DNA-binding domain-containing protein [Spirochaeta cellobiosiphila]|uniref:HU family DNA-binding protein n=1 Tax=Spirochaeta cellobiosiphila TaxID=504483 RepID=UPI00040161FC|nr:DNA-binding domain-containing protein [Spirochaeta cellobiosiphila]